jgi:GntR family transcriptional repressor for pyruvate dehydrogenase complex
MDISEGAATESAEILCEWLYHSYFMRMFRKIQPIFVYQGVVNQIQDAILSQQLKAGDRLPPEREFTKVFNTSRRTLREAMRVLEQKGLVEIRTGSKGGAFVADRSEDRLKESLAMLIRRRKVPHQKLVEFRVEIEGIVAGLAAERGKKGDIARLKDMLAKAEIYLKEGVCSRDQFNKAETELHLFLGEMSRNPIYDAIMKTIHEVLVFPSFKLLAVDETYMLEACRDWRNLVKAIEKNEIRHARSIIQGHVQNFSRYHRANNDDSEEKRGEK